MQRTAAGPRLYRVLKTLDAAYRRVHRHPVFHLLVKNGQKIGILVAVTIPIVIVAGIAYDRTHTQYYLLTGMHGATEAEIGHQCGDKLNELTQLEQLIQLNRE